MIYKAGIKYKNQQYCKEIKIVSLVVKNETLLIFHDWDCDIKFCYFWHETKLNRACVLIPL